MLIALFQAWFLGRIMHKVMNCYHNLPLAYCKAPCLPRCCWSAVDSSTPVSTYCSVVIMAQNRELVMACSHTPLQRYNTVYKTPLAFDVFVLAWSIVD